MNVAQRIKQDLKAVADASRAAVMQRFFKTGAGQYGEGDVFVGVSVPESRKIANSYFKSSDLSTVLEVLRSRVHEERLVALLMLVRKYESGEKGIAEFYLKHLRYVNNWDLVDLTAPNILGAHLAGRPRTILDGLARSDNLWERRIAIVATYYFIKNAEFEDTLRITESLLGDRHDLIHKAAGWMLREVGKRDQSVLERFLQRHYSKMPRTMLRYAIEKLPEKKKKFYLSRESR